MKHAGIETLKQLEPLLVRLREIEGLVERKPGIFYLRSKAFLHFHEDPAGVFADARLNGVEFQRFALATTGFERFAREVAATVDRLAGDRNGIP